MVLVLAGSGAISPVLGQRFPAFGGLELRSGVVFPDQADAGLTVSGEIDAGYILTPSLRALFGLSRFTADIDREPGGDEGSYRATGFTLGGRYDFVQRKSVAPYLRGELILQRVSADAFDADVGALLEGSYVGLAAAAGARYLVDAAGRLSATAELRRTFVNNIPITALEVGVRFQPRGLRGYRRERGPIEVEATSGTVEPPRTAPAPATLSAAQPPRVADTARAAAQPQRAAEAARAAEARITGDATARARDEEVRRLRSRASEAMLRQGLARAVAAMPGLASFNENDREFILTLGGNAFPSGASTLMPSARAQLRVLATVLAGYPGHIVRLEGHADGSGERRANLLLSAERAAVVRAALIAEGADPLWVSSRGLGPDNPIASNATPSGRATNRRVEIRISREFCPSLPMGAGEGVLVCAR